MLREDLRGRNDAGGISVISWKYFRYDTVLTLLWRSLAHVGPKMDGNGLLARSLDVFQFHTLVPPSFHPMQKVSGSNEKFTPSFQDLGEVFLRPASRWWWWPSSSSPSLLGKVIPPSLSVKNSTTGVSQRSVYSVRSACLAVLVGSKWEWEWLR